VIINNLHTEQAPTQKDVTAMVKAIHPIKTSSKFLESLLTAVMLCSQKVSIEKEE
jgi:hypothetical protein